MNSPMPSSLVEILDTLEDPWGNQSDLHAYLQRDFACPDRVGTMAHDHSETVEQGHKCIERYLHASWTVPTASGTNSIRTAAGRP